MEFYGRTKTAIINTDSTNSIARKWFFDIHRLALDKNKKKIICTAVILQPEASDHLRLKSPSQIIHRRSNLLSFQTFHITSCWETISYTKLKQKYATIPNVYNFSTTQISHSKVPSIKNKAVFSSRRTI